ncbi:MAG: hypothetical protein R6U96_06890 [Promethearchaeia archaeon]
MYELDNEKDVPIYNPWDPHNWSTACQFNLTFSVILFLDLGIGRAFGFHSTNGGYLWNIFSGYELTNYLFPLVTYCTILALSPVLNTDIDDSPFFGAILVKILLFLGSAQFTLIGIIAEFILDLGYSVLIVTVLIFNILFAMEQPSHHSLLMVLGIALFVIQLVLDVAISGWCIGYVWIILILGGLALAIFLIRQKKTLIGSVLSITLLVLNNYILPMGINSLGVGSLIILASAILLLISNILGV